MIRKSRKRTDPRLWEWPDEPEEDSFTYLKSYQSRNKISNPLPEEPFALPVLGAFHHASANKLLEASSLRPMIRPMAIDSGF
jgi:hypothetical protein